MANHWTLSAYAVRTNWMMEQIRENALRDTIEEFKVADRRYYETCENGKEVEKLISEMYALGMSVEDVCELDIEIRDFVMAKEA